MADPRLSPRAMSPRAGSPSAATPSTVVAAPPQKKVEQNIRYLFIVGSDEAVIFNLEKLEMSKKKFKQSFKPEPGCQLS